ncbi:hypothetical protein ACFVJK_40270 [Streptomyces sp. NPDC127172]|uniref:hypothetical protein n=1 Tax=Streptomyces sp. NPDC127172 TaxID=3345382 RepID=UPI00362A012B
MKDKAAHAAEQARTRATQTSHLLQEKTPEIARHTAAKGARAERESRTLLAAAVGAALVWLACRRRKE